MPQNCLLCSSLIGPKGRGGKLRKPDRGPRHLVSPRAEPPACASRSQQLERTRAQASPGPELRPGSSAPTGTERLRSSHLSAGGDLHTYLAPSPKGGLFSREKRYGQRAWKEGKV